MKAPVKSPSAEPADDREAPLDAARGRTPGADRREERRRKLAASLEKLQQAARRRRAATEK
jgi:hypothetical protein